MTERQHENEKKEDCWCQPTVIPVKQDDGSIDWIYVHNRETPK